MAREAIFEAGGDAARDFHERFVRMRRPVVLTDVPSELAPILAWSNSELKRLAGEAVLEVETRGQEEEEQQQKQVETPRGLHGVAAQRFGKGRKLEGVRFAHVIERLASGDDSMYQTTQSLKLDPESRRPMVTSAPVTQLVMAGQVPVRPKLLGNLVPMNLNVWMGNTKEGTCSGLHHDFHDNLYVLARGRKRFELYSPADAPFMYTVGALAKVHANGRINYEGFPTNADGSEVGSLEALLASESKEAAETELAAAEAAVARGDKGARKRLERAEEALDAALGNVLDAGDFDDFDEEEGEADRDDYEEDEEEGEGEGEGESDIDENDEEQAPPKAKRAKIDAADPTQTPLNFSRVRLDMPIDKVAFPLFGKAKRMTVEIAAGEMLFLPAGWFHCVTSYNGAARDAEFSGHLAFNYWMHPPDTMDFDKPYSSPFWQRDWDARKTHL